MEQYFGSKANTYYLIDRGCNLAYSFDNFGTAINKCSADSALVELMGKCSETDIISILGEAGSKMCEIYYNGYSAVVNKPYLDVYAKLDKVVNRKNHLVFTIKHQERVKQILLPLIKGSTSLNQLSSALGGLEWSLVES